MSNRLAAESSLYLRQHAENPVDWWPWGPEAHAEAVRRDVPVLLSIGYSSCHWCHVMAHESFEDPATAEYMNEHFVCIKVDREERPDVDAIYLDAAQAMSGHGGWPLTAFLDHRQLPFFAGTYFPAESRDGMPSLMELLVAIDELWHNRRSEVEERGGLIAGQLKLMAELKPPEAEISAETLQSAATQLTAAFDEDNGGFGAAPKFPPHSVLEHLLLSEPQEQREMATRTLRAVVCGGIHDQLAGGFHRYSVDARWRVPHFEKMLYDNALLARSLLHGHLVSGDPLFAEAARRTLDWMLAELHEPGHGFAAALDADSPDANGELREGAFYAWPEDELRAVLEEIDPAATDSLLAHFGADGAPEFDSEHVLRLVPEVAVEPELLKRARSALLDHRNKRPHPQKDEKRLACWNALAISAFAEAGAVLKDQRYIDTALGTAEFIAAELTGPDGRIRRSWQDGRPSEHGFLEDQAAVAAAELTLFELTGEERWYVKAQTLCRTTIEHFADNEHGGFFSSADDAEALAVRQKDIEDNPTPSGSSLFAHTLIRLSALSGEADLRDAALPALRAVQGSAGRLPLGFGCALQAIELGVGPLREVAIVGDQQSRGPLLDVLLTGHRPRLVRALGSGKGATAVPLLEGRSASESGALAFVCEHFSCQAPVGSPAELAALLDQA